MLRRWVVFWRSLSDKIFCEAGAVLGGCRKPTWSPESILATFFVFPNAMLASIPGRFLEAPELLNGAFSIVNLTRLWEYGVQTVHCHWEGA